MSEALSEIYVPDFDGMAWITYDGNRHTAAPSEAYWQLHRVGKGLLRGIGLRVDRSSGDWQVIYEPCVGAGEARSTIAKVTTEAAAAEAHRLALEADAKAAREAAMTVDDKEQARLRDERWARDDARRAAARAAHKASVIRIQAEAKYLLETFGDFTHKRALTADLATRERLDSRELNKLAGLVNDTKRKHVERLARAEEEVGQGVGVDWSDETVERVVIYLTNSDPDHAGVINDAGWSKADSSTGHWCRAMLAPAKEDDWAMVSIAADRKRVAIATARRVVGKYERQLRTARVL